MIINKKINGLFVLSFYAVIILFIQPVYPAVIITGMKSNVDLSDILYPGRKIHDVIELKKVCVEITDRYHQKGYTAFKIQKSILKKDGSVELYFSDPKVENIFVTGVKPYNERIKAKIFKKNESFNEFLLNKNINEIKKEYPVKKIKVDIKRNADENIDIFVSADKGILNSIIKTSSDPLYGGLASVALSFDSGDCVMAAEFETTAGIRDASYTKTGIDCIFGTPFGNEISCLLGIQYEEKEVYFKEPEIITFDNRIIKGETGLLYNKGVTVFSFTAFSSYVDYHNYQELENKYYFPGISAAVKYNDADYRIDPLDLMMAEIKSEYLWNPVEKEMEIRILINSHFSVQVAESLSLTASLFSNYTSENKEIFNEYVFDRILPVRSKDYTTAAWRHTGVPGVLIDIYNRLIYLSPEYYVSVYDARGVKEFVHAASVKGLIKSDMFSSEIKYTVEAGKSFAEGVFIFEVKAML